MLSRRSGSLADTALTIAASCVTPLPSSPPSTCTYAPHHATSAPRYHSHQHFLTSLTPHTSAFLRPIALSSYPPTPTHDSSAPRRGFMPSGAAQLPRQRVGTCRRRGAVIGCRAPQTLQPERGLGRRAGAAVVVAVEDVRPPATPYVALSAVRTSVHLVARTSSVQATGVHPSGVIRVSGQTGVRTDRCPVSAASASALSGPRWIPDVGAAGQATFGGLGSTCRCGPPAGLCVAGTRVDGRPGLPLRRRTGCGAALAAWPTKGAGPAPGCRSVGWEHEKEQVLTSPPQVRSGQVAGVMLDHGAGPEGGDHAAWLLSWCWSGVVRLWRARPVQRGIVCGRSAAAVCEARCPLGVDSALTS